MGQSGDCPATGPCTPARSVCSVSAQPANEDVGLPGRPHSLHKSLHRRSHKGGRGGGLMSALRASRRLTGRAPGIPGNNNQPPRRQLRVSVAAGLSFQVPKTF